MDSSLESVLLRPTDLYTVTIMQQGSRRTNMCREKTLEWKVENVANTSILKI